jgi:hypothetical protein
MLGNYLKLLMYPFKIKDVKSSFQFSQSSFPYIFFLLGLHIYGLTSAASGYHKVLEENRKLYNQVQDLKGNFANFFFLSKCTK